MVYNEGFIVRKKTCLRISKAKSFAVPVSVSDSSLHLIFSLLADTVCDTNVCVTIIINYKGGSPNGGRPKYALPIC